MTKNTLHFLLFSSLLILSNSGEGGKKNCICNNNGTNNGDDGGEDGTNGNTSNNNDGISPSNNDNVPGGDIDYPDHQTGNNEGNNNNNEGNMNNNGGNNGPMTTSTPQTTYGYEYVTSYVWVWKQGNKEKEAIRQKKIYNNNKKTKTKPFEIMTTLDKYTNNNNINNNNINNNNNVNNNVNNNSDNISNNNSNNNSNNGGEHDDDGPNGTDDDDDDDGCICNGSNNNNVPKTLPICYDGWAAWDWCKTINDCPNGYFCDTNQGCCPEMPWRKSQVSAVDGVTDKIEIFYEKHYISFILITIVISLVLFGSIFVVMYCMCIRKSLNDDKIGLMTSHNDNGYNANDVQLINMDTYQN